jgi:two-component system, cell cycle sensor histidine kinase and response regulator CckA
MLEFFRRLFSPDFMPHGMCYGWDPAVLWLNVISDSVIALAYYTIPLLLLSFARRRRDLQFHWVFLAFAIFILACGTTHVLGVWTVWTPVYRLDGLVKAITAVASLATAIMLIPLAPALVSLPSPTQLTEVNRQLNIEIQERKTAEEKVRRANEALEQRVAERTRELSSAVASLKQEVEDRRRAEDALRQSEGKLLALLESAAQGIIAVDESGVISIVNAKTEEMFGYKREELLGRNLSVLVPERFRNVHEGHTAAYFAHPRTREMGQGMDLAGLRRDGTEFPVEISLSYVAEEEKRLALSFITDITERKRFDEQLRQTQRLESVGILAGGVAHDFNNLLTGIMGNASLALDMLDPGTPAAPLIADAVLAGERAAGLVRQLLAYSGRGQFVIDALDLSKVVREITSLIQTSISKTVHLKLELAENLPPIEADVAQLHQLIMNLVINGSEAIGQQPGTVTVATGLRTIDEATLRTAHVGADAAAGEYVFLDVTDTGSGMDEGTISRIFDPFFTTKFTGRGLGLSAVLGIVRSHRGAIWVESKPGQGATFRVLLPAVEVRPGVAPPRKTLPAISARPAAVVLVVDDEPAVRKVTTRMLEACGLSVRVASDGNEGLAMYLEHRQEIALVLLDLTMPGLDGEEVFLEIRKVDPLIPIVLMTGFTEHDASARFRGRNLNGLLQKPFRIDMIRELLASQLTPLRGQDDVREQ